MPQDSNQPNVIVFFTDQQRWDTSGLHGNPLDLTPNFDRMAQRGYTCPPLVYVSTRLWSRALVPTNGIIRHTDGMFPKRYSAITKPQDPRTPLR